MLATLTQDLNAALERDPAARSRLEVMLLYPGVHALWSHRVAHALWVRRFRLLARWLSQISRFWTGIEIHPGAQIGTGCFIDHGMGLVIGETAVVGRNVTLFHGVTLGGTTTARGVKRHPTLEDDVTVGAGAKVLGDIVIGQGSRVGANAVVVKPVPPNSVVVGVPGQIVVRSKPRPIGPDLNHTQLPDTIGLTVAALLTRVEVLERRLHVHVAPPADGTPIVHAPDHELWHGEDFQI